MGDRPIIIPGSLLESAVDEQFMNHIIEIDSFEDDSDAATEILLTPGSSKDDTDSLSSTSLLTAQDNVLDLNAGENTTSTPTPQKVDPKVEKKDRVLSSRRGKSKKRSRNETLVANMCEMIHKQQEAADDRFFKMEEERQRKEIEREEKRRKEERQILHNKLSSLLPAILNIGNVRHSRRSACVGKLTWVQLEFAFTLLSVQNAVSTKLG